MEKFHSYCKNKLTNFLFIEKKQYLKCAEHSTPALNKNASNILFYCGAWGPYNVTIQYRRE